MIKKVIIIGTGKLPYLCAQEVQRNRLECQVYEYGAYGSSMLNIQCEKSEIKYRKVSKELLIDILTKESEETLIVSANNTFLFSSDIVEKQNISIINFHPALLPMHPGRNAEAWAIYNQDQVSGITWHWVDSKIDHGCMIMQEKIILDDRMTSLKLMIQQIKLAYVCFEKIFPMLLQEQIQPQICETANRNVQLHLSKDIPNNGALDINWDTQKMSAFLRAMDYGKLKVLGEPFCMIGEEKYRWEKYSIQENTGKETTDSLKGVFVSGNTVIHLVNLKREGNTDERVDLQYFK